MELSNAHLEMHRIHYNLDRENFRAIVLSKASPKSSLLRKISSRGPGRSCRTSWNPPRFHRR